MKQQFLAFLTFVALLLSVADTANATSWSTQTASSVTITDIGSLGGGQTFGYGINDNGQVTGVSNTLGYYPRQHAFLWNPATNGMIDLGGFSGTGYYSQISGQGINNSGQVAGYSTGFPVGNGSTTTHAFVWTGAKFDIGTLGGQTSIGSAINDSGLVTGYSSFAGNTSFHAFVWNHNTYTITDLGTLGGSNSYGNGINNSNYITGYSTLSGNDSGHAFVWNPASKNMLDLGTLGGNMSFGQAINDSGQIAGYSYLDHNSAVHAFIWNDENEGMIDLGTLGGDYSYGRDINDLGLIAGSSSTLNGDNHAFVYDSGTMYDLNSLVQLATGEYLNTATSINELSQIVAISNFGKTYVLTPTSNASPVPIPSTGLLLGSSISFLAFIRRRQQKSQGVKS